MLSLHTLKSASTASHYYQQGDYYTQAGASEHSLWLGKGAEALGLRGSVDFNSFQGLLQGRLPNGQVMTQVAKGQYHRPGYDLTFSAPKSLSILALLTGNRELLNAHRQAVKETLSALEQKVAGCRNKKNGAIDIERTGNFTLATFEHSDSREGDPNLHTHCVLMNLTQRMDGQFRTLYADELYEDKLLNGLEYRSRLAHQLMHLGFEIELKEKGLFEIKGMDKTLIEFYSKRRAEIKQCLSEMQTQGGKAAAMANLLTRAPKVHADIEERQQRWLTELEAFGSSLEALDKVIEAAKQRGPITPPSPETIAAQALESAIRDLSEKRSAFSLPVLVKRSKQLSLLPCHEGELLAAIEQRVAQQSLIYLQDKTLSTPAIQQLKQQTLNTLQAGKNSVHKLAPNWMASLLVKLKTPDPEERQVLKALLTTPDRQVLLSADSSLMLEQILKSYVALSQAQGFYPRVLTQNNLQVSLLKQKLVLEKVSTLSGFLLSAEARLEKRAEPQNSLEAWDRRIKKRAARDIWIVEGEVSIQQLNQLGHFAESLGARILFTQLKRQAALTPLKEQGITEIKTKASQARLEALTTQEQLLRNLENLERSGHLQVHPDAAQRQAVSVEQYLNFKQNEKKQLITLNYSEKAALNELVRGSLKQTGRLRGSEHGVTILRPLQLSREEKSQVHAYQPGEVIRFRMLSNTLQDRYFTVAKVDLEKNCLELHAGQQELFWNPGLDAKNLKQLTVFKSEARALQIGEELVWTQTLKSPLHSDLDRLKGQKAQVMAIKDNQAVVQLQNGKITELGLQDPGQQHWDYGYSVHLKEADLSSTKSLVITAQSKALEFKTVPLLNELLGFAKTNSIQARLVVDDLVALKKTVQMGRHPGRDDYPLPTALFSRLQKECLKFNFSHPKPKTQPLNSALSAELKLACDSVDRVCVAQFEREAVIPLKTLKKELVRSAALKVSLALLEQALELALEQGWLIPVGQTDQGEELVTTQANLLIEQQCIEKMQAGKNQLAPLFNKDAAALQDIRHHPRLTLGQKQAIELILTTQDRVVVVQGIAGAGKTTALKEIKRLCEGHHQTVVLANTASAKNQAKSASGLQAQTTTQFLTQMEREVEKDPIQAKKEFSNHLFILDEASLASSQEVLRLAILIEKADAKLVLLGDVKQQGSIGAGLSLHDLLAYGANKAVMQENVRLKSAKAFLAMKQAYANDAAASLRTLKDAIEEIPDKQEALNRMVAAYCEKLTDKESPLVITPLNKDRQYVNAAIREKLKEKGLIEQSGFKLSVFVPVDKREVDKKEALSYQQGEIIRFNTSHSRLNIQAGDYVQVQGIDLANQRLHLTLDGKLLYWSPKDLEKPSHIEVYRQEAREFCRGDTLVFKRNQESKGIFNGDRATVLKVQSGVVELLLSNNQSLQLDLSQAQNQHLDYGYALTTYAAQGRDVPFVIAYGEGPSPRARTSEQLKVGDVVVLPKDKVENLAQSKLVQVKKLESSCLTLQYRDGQGVEVSTYPTESWAYFPPFEQRKAYELPRSTSLQSFIIQITRGDGLLLIVPNIEDFQKTLERHQQPKRSALSYWDANWPALHQRVNRLVANIQGKAEAGLKQRQELTANPIRSFSKPAFVDKELLEGRLQANLLGYASQWLGEPSAVTGREARWGRKGSFSLILEGLRAGLWHNWETGEKGKGLINLYSKLYGVSFKAAIRELAQTVGVEIEQQPSKRIRISQKNHSVKDKTEQGQQSRIQQALSLYHKALPISGTLAARYLREHRGIAGDLPKDFRFLHSDKHFQTKKILPALIAPYRDQDDKIIGITRTYLNPDGSQYRDSFIDKTGQTVKAIAKANKGVFAQGSVKVQDALIPKTLFIAEGLETALSVAQAAPHERVVASLSVHQLQNVPVPAETNTIVICADNDPASSHTKQSVVKAVESFLSKGLRVFIALPPDIPVGMKKCDFNDLLKREGIESVQGALEQRVEIRDVNLLKNNEPRLQNDLNRICAENDLKTITEGSKAQKEGLTLDKPLAWVQKERGIERSFER